MAKKVLTAIGAAILILIALSVLLLPSGSKRPTLPKRLVNYKVVDQWDISNGGFGRVVVIAPSAANETSLRALGDEFRYNTRNDRNAFIFVYDDARAAAMRRDALRDSLSRKDARFHDAHLVAMYSRNINTDFHRLTIAPKGLNGPLITVPY